MKMKTLALTVGMLLGACQSHVAFADLLENVTGQNPIPGLDPFPGAGLGGGQNGGGEGGSQGVVDNEGGQQDNPGGDQAGGNQVSGGEQLSELEPNDDKSRATPLLPDSTYEGRLEAPEDQDWFHFQTNASNSIVELTVPGSEGNWSMELVDANGETLLTMESRSEDQKFAFVLVDRGDYYLRLYPSGKAETAYSFSIGGDQVQAPVVSRYREFLDQSQFEVEPNNHMAVAVPITPGIPVSGQLSAMEDEDWYVLDNITPNASFNVEMPASPFQWRMDILDSAGNVLQVRESSTEEEKIFTAKLEKVGRFYLVVSAIDDERDNYTFNVTGSGLQNPGGRNAKANFNDTEIESNDTLDQASKLNSAVRIVGQLMTSSDIDIYELETDGDEILSVELCPGNAPCAAQMKDGSGPWVAYLFDGRRVTQDMLQQQIPLLVCGPGDDGLSGTSDDQAAVAYAEHLYLSLHMGLLDGALLGVIDPAFGQSRKVEVGLKDPGKYYLVISSPLKRDGDGSVVLKKEVDCGEGKIKEESIVVEPFSDDPYDLQVVQTRLTPSIGGESASKSALLQSTVEDGILRIPVVEVNGIEYSAQLKRVDGSGKIRFELLGVERLGTTLEAKDVNDLKLKAMRAVVENDVLHIPAAGYQGKLYSADFRIFTEGGRRLLELLRATPLN